MTDLPEVPDDREELDNDEPESDDDVTPGSVVSRLIDEIAQCRERGLTLFREACPALATLGVTSVRIPYNGYGDEGCVEPPVATRSDDEWVDLPRELEEKLMDAAEWFLPDGWENNDGAYGELTLDVVRKRIDNELFWRVETSEREREGIDL
jgi:hypothetical protein